MLPTVCLSIQNVKVGRGHNCDKINPFQSGDLYISPKNLLPSNSNVSSKFYDKRDDYDSDAVTFFVDNCIPRSLTYLNLFVLLGCLHV